MMVFGAEGGEGSSSQLKLELNLKLGQQSEELISFLFFILHSSLPLTQRLLHSVNVTAGKDAHVVLFVNAFVPILVNFAK